MIETLLLCAEIFFCRILDVSCSTLRTVLTVKEKTLYAALVGFFEASIWFLVVRQALASNMTGLEIAVAYGGGFAAGTFIGGTIARRFIRSNIVVQVVTTERNDELLHHIHDAGFAVKEVPCLLIGGNGEAVEGILLQLLGGHAAHGGIFFGGNIRQHVKHSP